MKSLETDIESTVTVESTVIIYTVSPIYFVRNTALSCDRRDLWSRTPDRPLLAAG